MARARRPTTYKRVAIKRRKPSKYARSGKVPLKIRQYVRRTLHTNAENKMRVNYGANQPLTLNGATGQTLPLILGCLQGTDDQTRNGNQIRITKGIWRGTFNLLPYNATTNPSPAPIWVKLWIVRDLRFHLQISSMDPVQFSKFFRVGNSTVGFQYNPLDISLDVNKDIFRVVWTKTFKLGNASAFNSGIPSNPNSYFDNSPSAKVVTFNYGKWIKKQLKFDDNTSQYPQNANLYLVMQTVPADGSTPPVNGALVEYHYTNSMYFEDL